MPQLQLRQWISAGVLMSVFLWYGSVQTAQPLMASAEYAVAISQWPVAPVPVRLSSTQEPAISAQSAYVIDFDSAAVLYSKNATQTFPPASLTKLMTAIIAREIYPAATVFTIPSPQVQLDSRLLLIPGEQMAVENILAAALIQSNNQAAQLLAQNYPEGETAFVQLMNERAQRLHLTDTQYANSIGFDHPEQFSTARDSAILAREVLSDPFLRRLVASAQYEINTIALSNPRLLRNTNQLLGVDERISGVKTGTTTEAGQVLVTLADINGQAIIIVVLGSTDRYQDTLTLLQWIEEQYVFENLNKFQTSQ